MVIVRETLINRAIPTSVSQYMSTDLFTYKEKGYLLIVDMYSKHLELIECNNTTHSVVIIKHLKRCFARYCKPDNDNGPKFTNIYLKEFLNVCELEHKTSSPRYP